MPGVLEFTLGMQSGAYNSALAASVKQTQTFRTWAQLAAAETERMAKDFAAVKPPPIPPSEPVERHAGSVRHLRHELGLVSEAAQQFGANLGPLGRLAGVAFSPWLVAIAGVTMAMDQFRERYEANVEFITGIVAQMQRTMAAKLEAVAAANREALASNTTFSLGINHSADSIDRETQAMQNRIAQFDAMTSAQREVIAMQERATEATIDADEAQRKITPVEAERRRLAAQEGASAGEHQAEISSLQNAIEEKEKRLKEAQQNLPAASGDHSQAVEAAKRGRAAIEAQKQQVENQTANREKAEKEAAEAKATKEHPGFGVGVLKVMEKIGLGGLNGAPTVGGIIDKKNKDMADLAETNRQHAVDSEIAGKDKLAQLERQQQYYDSAIEKAKKKAEIEKGNIDTLPQEIAQAKSLLEIRKKAVAQDIALQKGADVEKLRKEKAGAMTQVASGFGGTSFEKMGFHFGSGGPSILADHARATAEATRQTAAGIQALIGLLGTPQADSRAFLPNAMP